MTKLARKKHLTNITRGAAVCLEAPVSCVFEQLNLAFSFLFSCASKLGSLCASVTGWNFVAFLGSHFEPHKVNEKKKCLGYLNYGCAVSIVSCYRVNENGIQCLPLLRTPYWERRRLDKLPYSFLGFFFVTPYTMVYFIPLIIIRKTDLIHAANASAFLPRTVMSAACQKL